MTKNVAWVGGPPGSSWKTMERKLAKDGINVVERHDKFGAHARFSKGLDAVLLCIDMASSDMIERVVKEATAPVIRVRVGYSNTRQLLIARGFITVNTDVVHDAIDAADAADTADNDNNTSKATPIMSNIKKTVTRIVADADDETLLELERAIKSRKRVRELEPLIAQLRALNDDDLIAMVFSTPDLRERLRIAVDVTEGV